MSDLLDLIQMYQFLYIGGLDAAKLINEKYDEFCKLQGKPKSLVKRFVDVCRLIFSKPNMMQVFTSVEKLQLKNKFLFSSFQSLCLNNYYQKFNNDNEVFRRDIINRLDDPQMNVDLKRLIMTAVRDNDELVKLGYVQV